MKHFKIEEFDSPDMPGSGQNMDAQFLEKLDMLRGACGFPFKINSGYRSKLHNAKVGGKSGSSHTKGLAVDIHCTESSKRCKIVQHALNMGITRIGIANTFVHLDVDNDKVSNVIWTY